MCYGFGAKFHTTEQWKGWKKKLIKKEIKKCFKIGGGDCLIKTQDSEKSEGWWIGSDACPVLIKTQENVSREACT